MTSPTKAIKGPCQFYTLGCCKFDRDEDCFFSHDRNLCKPGSIEEPCRHFMSNYCRNGKFCLFLHDTKLRERKREALDRNSEKSIESERGNLVLRSDSVSHRKVLPTSSVDSSRSRALNIRKEDDALSQELFNLKLTEPSTYTYGAVDRRIHGKDAISGTSTAWNSLVKPGLQNSPRTHVSQHIQLQQEMCKFYASGHCRYGLQCRFLHQPNHGLTEERNGRIQKSLEQSNGLECSICLEIVEDKHDPRFGLLTGCEHVFCLGCIRSWRSAQISDAQHEAGLSRSCPTCRQISYFIVPSSVFPLNPGLKTQIVEDYRQNLAAQDCKYYKRGSGTCPFGTSCFYMHRDQVGNCAERDTLRTFKDSDGNTKVEGLARISDYVVSKTN